MDVKVYVIWAFHQKINHITKIPERHNVQRGTTRSAKRIKREKNANQPAKYNKWCSLISKWPHHDIFHSQRLDVEISSGEKRELDGVRGGLDEGITRKILSQRIFQTVLILFFQKHEMIKNIFSSTIKHLFLLKNEHHPIKINICVLESNWWLEVKWIREIITMSGDVHTVERNVGEQFRNVKHFSTWMCVAGTERTEKAN